MVLQALIDKTKIDPSEVGDIVVGTVLGPGSQRAIECRIAALYAGFPGTTYCDRLMEELPSNIFAQHNLAIMLMYLSFPIQKQFLSEL